MASFISGSVSTLPNTVSQSIAPDASSKASLVSNNRTVSSRTSSTANGMLLSSRPEIRLLRSSGDRNGVALNTSRRPNAS